MSNSSSAPSAQNLDLNEDQQEQRSILTSFLRTVYHFFGRFADLFSPVDDPRAPKLIIYPLDALLFTGVLMFLCRLGARRQVTHMLRGNGASAAKFRALFGTAMAPHGDTLNAAFCRLDPAQVQAVIIGMVKTLIRRKVLYRYRLRDRYFVIAVDGTGRLVFPERHCAHCLTATHQGRTIYYHPVLEAKLVLANGGWCPTYAFSILTEFVENPGEYPDKQDCELKAFYRLTKRLKEAFPRLPICLSLDSLFAGGPVMRICEDYDWAFMIVYKAGAIPAIQQEFEALGPLAPENHLTFHTGPQSKTRQDYHWINDIAYVDTEKHEHTVGVLQCLEEKPKANGQRKTTRFKWITNLKLTRKNVIALANQGGRIRWKIENACLRARTGRKASTCKRTGASTWNTLTPATRPPVRSSICSYRSRI